MTNFRLEKRYHTRNDQFLSIRNAIKTRDTIIKKTYSISGALQK